MCAEKMEEESVPYVTPVGLDFGTNNSLIAVIMKGHTQVTFIKTGDGDTRHGTYLYIPEDSKEKPVFGIEALAMLPSPNVIRLAKRAIGITAIQIVDPNIFNAKMANEGKQRMIEFKFEIDGKSVTKSVQDIIVMFLEHYKELVENNVQGETKWVVSKPQYWNHTQNKKFHECLVAAGITPLKVLTEPTAAISAYRAKAGDEVGPRKVACADLGAGTFDLVLQMDHGNGNFHTYATGGDDLLGSSNIDEIFLEVLKEDLKKEQGYNEDRFVDLIPENREKVKEMKHLLATLSKVSKNFAGVTKKPFTFTIDQQRKDLILKPFFQRVEAKIDELIERVVEGSRKKYSHKAVRNSVELVAMVGGGMKLNYFGDKLLPKVFPKAVIVGRPNSPDSVNPDEAVAIGACTWAASLSGTPIPQGLPPQPVNRNVLSKSLGVETVTSYGNRDEKRWFSKILHAGVGIPTMAMDDRFSTCRDNQGRVLVEIYQGEGTYTTDDGVLKIGQFEIEVETPNTAFQPKIEIEMHVSDDNILTCLAGEVGREKVSYQVQDPL